MEREQHVLRTLGFCGILKQSFKLIISWRKVFTQIALVLILPLAVLFLVHFQISEAIFRKFYTNGTKPNHISASDWAYWIFRAGYFTVTAVLSLLSTAAVVYTVASIFASKEVKFKTAMKAVPKVWKRLAVTFVCIYVLFVIYNAVAIVIFALWIAFLGTSSAGIAAVAILSILYLAGIVYLAVIWFLAAVVSVLEDSYGIRALKKSKALVKGKAAVTVFLTIMLGFCFGAVESLYGVVVAGGVVDQIAVRIVVGVVAMVLLTVVVLVLFVVESVLYLVCKSHHREEIDKSLLSGQLEIYLGGHYADPSHPINVQMTRPQV